MSRIVSFAVAGAKLGGLPGAVGGAIAGAASNGLFREIGYHMDNLIANKVPDPNLVLECYYAGRITKDQLRTLLGYNGVDWQITNGNADFALGTYTVQAWKHIVDLHTPLPSVEQFASLWRQGIIPDETYIDVMRRKGWPRRAREYLLGQTPVVDIGTAQDWWSKGIYNTAEYRVSWVRSELPVGDFDTFAINDTKVPSVEWAIHHLYLGDIPEATANDVIDRNGWATSDYDVGLVRFAAPLPPRDAMRMFWRGHFDAATAGNHLRAGVCRDTIDVTDYAETLYPQPNAAEAIHLAGSHVLDDAAAARYGYDAEMDVGTREWLRREGWDRDSTLTDPSNGFQRTDNWTKLLWRGHWQHMGPGEINDAIHKLRPGRIARYQVDVPGVQPFSLFDFHALLGRHNYSPTERQWMQAVGYRAFEFRQHRIFYVHGFVGDGELRERLLDSGYNQADAADMVNYLRQERDYQDRSHFRAMENASQIEHVRNMVRYYVEGFFSRADAYSRMVTAGVKPPAADLMLSNAEAEERSRQLGIIVKEVERDWKEGSLTSAQVTANLAIVGIQPTKIANLLIQWNSERNLQSRMATSANILNWVRKGLMTPAQATIRLINLGWQQPDLTLAISEAEGGLLKAQATAATAAQRAAAQQAKALANAQRQALAVIAKAQSAVRRITPIATLKKWYVQGTVSLKYATNRLANAGYTPAEVNNYIAEWDKEKTKASMPKKLSVSQLKRMYQSGLLPESDVVGRLAADGYDQTAVAAFMNDWKVDARIQTIKVKHVAVSTVGSWYKDGVIEYNDVVNMLSALGVVQQDIDLYVDDWDKHMRKGVNPSGPT